MGENGEKEWEGGREREGNHTKSHSIDSCMQVDIDH
jgi:hypothetical protein